MSENEQKKQQDEFEEWVSSLSITDIKRKFLVAYKATYGNISASCRAVHIVRNTFYNWREADLEFAEAIKSIEPEEDFLDVLEGELKKKAIIEKDITALIFLAKTKGKGRGYVERQERVLSGTTIDVTIKKEESSEEEPV